MYYKFTEDLFKFENQAPVFQIRIRKDQDYFSDPDPTLVST